MYMYVSMYVGVYTCTLNNAQIKIQRFKDLTVLSGIIISPNVYTTRFIHINFQ